MKLILTIMLFAFMESAGQTGKADLDLNPGPRIVIQRVPAPRQFVCGIVGLPISYSCGPRQSGNHKKIEIRDAEDGSPVIAATITVKDPSGYSKLMAADSLGFALIQNVNHDLNYELAVSAVGYEPVVITKQLIPGEVPVIHLKRSTRGMPGVVIVSYSAIRCRYCYRTCKSVCRRESNSVGVEQLPFPSTSLVIYPNPVKRESCVIIQTSSAMSGSYHMVNSAGQLIQSGDFNAKLNRFSLDLKTVAADIYFVTMKDAASGKTSTGKIVVE